LDKLAAERRFNILAAKQFMDALLSTDHPRMRLRHSSTVKGVSHPNSSFSAHQWLGLWCTFNGVCSWSAGSSCGTPYDSGFNPAVPSPQDGSAYAKAWRAWADVTPGASPARELLDGLLNYGVAHVSEPSGYDNPARAVPAVPRYHLMSRPEWVARGFPDWPQPPQATGAAAAGRRG
jgi:hypothetical protein